MAYTVIPSADIQAGKPTKEEIFQQIRTNQETFNDAITLLQGTAAIDVFNMRYDGNIDQYTTAEILARSPAFKAPVSAGLVGFSMTLLSPSTSGTLSVDLEKSTDNGINWSSLLTSDVLLTGLTTGSVSGTVNWIDPPAPGFTQGDLLRIRIKGLQTGQGSFLVHIYGELS